ncbi:PaaI family thioesterase [Streptomyces sp. SID6673]|nr:PaaI family thioesterase [Streptomyces sp. SID11726]NEB23872.1 PaaI family thioesterase [Streptomyces sp. SID6673]NED64413.1 PaaI family thioesterase [Streptomyces sp. SID10244]
MSVDDDLSKVGSEPSRAFVLPNSVPATPALSRFVVAMRRMQDLARAAQADDTAWNLAAEQVEAVCETLEPHLAPPGGYGHLGRAVGLPAFGNPLVPPWVVESAEPSGDVRVRGEFSRYHVGGNNAVHGGMISLFYDWVFGQCVVAADRAMSRTAFLHVDYRGVTPIHKPLEARGRISRLDGRKAFIEAEMTDGNGTVLSQATGLMIQLLPHQP